MRSNKYRVWDTEDKHYLEANVFLAPDGYLYAMEQDSGWELLTTRWFNEKMFQEKYKGHSSVDYARITKEVEAEIRQRQQEWFIVEFATDYLDKHDFLIYAGDLLYDEGMALNKKGESIPYQRTIEVQLHHFLCDVAEWLSPEIFAIIGNIHETPELLPQEQIAGS